MCFICKDIFIFTDSLVWIAVLNNPEIKRKVDVFSSLHTEVITIIITMATGGEILVSVGLWGSSLINHTYYVNDYNHCGK